MKLPVISSSFAPVMNLIENGVEKSVPESWYVSMTDVREFLRTLDYAHSYGWHEGREMFLTLDAKTKAELSNELFRNGLRDSIRHRENNAGKGFPYEMGSYEFYAFTRGFEEALLGS